jgi:hypothetical protein
MLKKIFLIFIGILIPFSIAFALEIDWPPSPLGTDLTDASTLTDLVKYLYEWGIALGGLAAFIALLIAGFIYLTSVGDPQKMADARGRIIWALAGLVLLLAAWLILNTINPDLTNLVKLGESWGCDCAPTTIPCSDCKPSTPPYICLGDPSPGNSKKEGTCVAQVATPSSAPPAETPCESVKVQNVNTSASTTININECENFSISSGATLNAIATPALCQGMLKFYSETGCNDSSSPGALWLDLKNYRVNNNIKSIKLISSSSP